MKFRTDFVTNSSSSSFLSCFLSFKKLPSELIFNEVEGWELSFLPFKQDIDGISCWDYKIKDLDELLACLYFYGAINELDYSREGLPLLDRGTVPIIISAFLFIAEKLPFPEMITNIRNYITAENTDYTNWLNEHPWIEDRRIAWRNSDEVQELLDMDPDDYDEEELSEVIKNSFREIFQNDNLFNDVDENVLVELSHREISGTDISDLLFEENGEKHGEDLAGPCDDFIEEYRSMFPQISKNDPLFEKEKKVWLNIIERYFRTDLDLIMDLDIDDALEAGDITEVWIDHIGYQEHDEFFYFEGTPQNDSLFDTQTTSDEDRATNDAINLFCTSFNDFSYSELIKCIEKDEIKGYQLLQESSYISDEYTLYRIFLFELENPFY